jgi:hypothetical protein
MSKLITIKFSGSVTLDTSVMHSDFADDVREMCDLDPFEAIEDEHIKLFVEELGLQELAGDFTDDITNDADITEVIVG